jgi:hypothetical protein
VTPLEDVVAAAFAEARAAVEPNPDLFARVVRGVEEARQRHTTRWRACAGAAVFALALAALGFACTDRDNGRIVMPWWTIELITDIVLVALAVVLGPFIKRFGRSYAADVFRANPRTGKSYLMLTDVAYYLIFAAFVLFTISFERRSGWIASTGNQLEHEVARVGGILLIMGVLHAVNVVALPVIGRLLESNRRLDLSGTPRTPPPAPPAPPAVGGGTWVLRIEPAPPADPPA